VLKTVPDSKQCRSKTGVTTSFGLRFGWTNMCWKDNFIMHTVELYFFICSILHKGKNPWRRGSCKGKMTTLRKWRWRWYREAWAMLSPSINDQIQSHGTRNLQDINKWRHDGPHWRREVKTEELQARTSTSLKFQNQCRCCNRFCAHVRRCTIEENWIFRCSMKSSFQQIKNRNFWRPDQIVMMKSLTVARSEISSRQDAAPE